MRILAEVMKIKNYGLRTQSNVQNLFSDEFCAK